MVSIQIEALTENIIGKIHELHKFIIVFFFNSSEADAFNIIFVSCPFQAIPKSLQQLDAILDLKQTFALNA